MGNELQDFIGALLTNIALGQSGANEGSVEIAQKYRGDPFLTHFPIPRVVISDVAIDLKMAVSQAPNPGERVLTAQGRSQLAQGLSTAIANTSTSILANQAIDLEPATAVAWAAVQPYIAEQTMSLLPPSGTIQREDFTDSAVRLIGGALVRHMLNPVAASAGLSAQAATAPEQLAASISPVVRDQVEKLLDPILADHSTPSAVLRTLVTVQELSQVPPEHISTVHVKLELSNGVWTHSNGERVLKIQ